MSDCLAQSAFRTLPVPAITSVQAVHTGCSCSAQSEHRHALSRCHRCILAARSDFLAALLEQPLVKRGHMTHAALTQHEQQPRSPGTFWQNAYLPSEVC